eukprot:TRINITY_DN2635_c0_g1_i1.p1 TRINITY_DN2635_c0_g1~~TRINITY_DN2635_c0_g1_i1.p1  ORF type:complete len:365 (+),score=19.07 TRINITY_DN2635_c0_g1_i1:886-1980(+)
MEISSWENLPVMTDTNKAQQHKVDNVPQSKHSQGCKRKVRFSGIPKVPTKESEDYSLCCSGLLDQELQQLLQQYEVKCQYHDQSFRSDFLQQDANYQYMIQRRLQGIKTLKSIYQEQQWGLYDELLVIGDQFSREGKQVFKKRKLSDESKEQSSSQVVVKQARELWLQSKRLCQDSVPNQNVVEQIQEGVPGFDDMERLILNIGTLDRSDELIEGVEEVLSGFRDKIVEIRNLERQVAAYWCRQFQKEDAFAALYTKTAIHYLRMPYVVIGRCTSGEDEIDIDLYDGKISRRQAEIEVVQTGKFRLRNLGRREMIVDNVLVQQGRDVMLSHLSLIEVGGIELMFIPNHIALDKVKKRNEAEQKS